MNSTGTALLMSLILTMSSSTFAAFSTTTSSDLAELEAKVREAGPQESSKPKQDPNWVATAAALSSVRNDPQLSNVCANSKYITLADKYAVSIENETGKPCRLYDLSFPTLSTVIRAVKYSSLPAQKFTVRDYIDWMNGDFASIQKRMDAYGGPYNDTSMLSVSEDEVETADWVEKVQFRDERLNMVSMATGRRTLPRSFRASDLDIGSQFFFSPAERQQLNALIGLLRIAGSSDVVAQAWSDAAKNPVSFLQKIKFDWNDAKKAYDIALEGEFLPVSGPVALIDYRAPYKPAIEKMIRGLLGSALLKLTNFIPDLMVRNIVYIVIEDATMFIDRAYQYQYNRLEYALKGMSGAINGAVDHKLIELSQNLVYAAHTDLLTTYVTALAKGEKFDWMKLDRLGRSARYQVEKAREISMNATNSRLVLKSGCKSALVYDYFADCSKGGQPQGIYSLLSTQSVLFWNLGAPMVYNHKMPLAIPLKRGVSYILSVGLRLFEIRVPGLIKNSLGNALTEFAFAGTNDEAFLKSALLKEKQANGGKLPVGSEKILSTLYTFTMNPFLPHSEAREKMYIQVNKGLLKMPAVTAIQPARL